MKVKKFISTPRKGNIVKVYPAGREETRFGKVIGVIHQRRTRVSDDEEADLVFLREIAVLEKLDQVFDLIDCDYCLEADKVSFEKMPTNIL